MGCCHRHRSLIFSLLIFLVSSSTQVRFMAEGRTAFKLMEQASQMKGDQEEKTMNMRVMIGSRPPRCEMRCNTCRHCEAVQVPAVPQDQNQKKSSKSNQPDLSTTVSMRGDDSSNYKPMSWKCKCGDMIFNP